VAGGLRRGLVAAVLGTVLLVGGGAAIVSAATPDPSASPSATTETQPSDDGTTAPSETTRPKGDCPEGQDGQSDDSSEGTSG
jgi:hypothetical protein